MNPIFKAYQDAENELKAFESPEFFAMQLKHRELKKKVKDLLFQVRHQQNLCHQCGSKQTFEEMDGYYYCNNGCR